MRGLTLFLLSFSLLTNWCESATTTVFLVRHAEKQGGSKDPDLTREGQARAQKLAGVLRSVKLSACFASEYKRTQRTAAPTAQAMALKVSQRSAGSEEALAKEIREDFTGKAILFVGHSNTVPNLLKHLGVGNVPQLSESDYDNLFIVQLDDSRATTMMQLHYGQPAER